MKKYSVAYLFNYGNRETGYGRSVICQEEPSALTSKLLIEWEKCITEKLKEEGADNVSPMIFNIIPLEDE